MKTLTVYWTPFSYPSRKDYVSLLFSDPENILKTLKPSKNDNSSIYQYISCSSAKELYRNTFVLSSPIDSTVNIIKNNNNSFIDNDNDPTTGYISLWYQKSTDPFLPADPSSPTF